MSSTPVTEDHLRSVVCEILDDVFGIESPDPTSTPEELGIDSLGMTELIAEIEIRLDLPRGLDAKLAGIDRSGTLKALIEHLHALVNALPSPAGSPRLEL